MLDVCLLGTAGMMPLPHRWLTAALMRYNGSNLLIDCGEGTQIAIKEKGWTFKPIDVICFTHYHADHISGLPGLLLTMGNAERTEPLTMIGPKGLEKVVSALRMIAPELPFEIRYIELTGSEEDMEINGYHIHAFKVNHNQLLWIHSRDQTCRTIRCGTSQKQSHSTEIVESVTKRPDSHNGGWNYFYPGHGAWGTEKRNQGNLLYGHKTNRKHCKMCKAFRSFHL